MDRTLTISMKGLLVAGAVLLALVAAYLVGARGGPPPASAAAADAEASTERPALTMTGRGTATAVPDELTFTLSATAKRDTLQAAMQASSTAMRGAQRTLREYGVARGDLATTGLRMYPEYDYPSSGPAILTGYRVTQRASVRIGDLAQGGRAIGAVVGSGDADVEVGNIRLGVGDTDDVLAEARAGAVEQARTKAEQYAAAAGVDLGEVVSIREVTRRAARPVPLDYRAMRDAAETSAAPPITAWEQESGVTVEIVWSLAG
ncbi:SIMPL domain-containing protein [Nocardioides rotundus]|uniref:SIMPL domain-containing protein n=1 Tax=Nocardioides rotundus TaxID=1774216 RepID=UPI001CBF173B|nr:SIMPL domain-containing protein [Nocardioides rotundus]UAL31297.1 SIMPL domain-containing protein [Nocardioides rotundus]